MKLFFDLRLLICSFFSFEFSALCEFVGESEFATITCSFLSDSWISKVDSFVGSGDSGSELFFFSFFRAQKQQQQKVQHIIVDFFIFFQIENI